MKAAVQVSLFLSLFTSALHAAGPIYSAVLSGSGQEYATSVTSDAQGNVYVVGLTFSSDFPVTAGAFQTKAGGTSDAFIAKVGLDGKIIWASYLGGILDDWATGVALDSAGNVLVTGYTRSANFPLLNPIQSSLDNGVSDYYDAFVAKFDPTGANLLYSTLLGGQGDDGAAGVTVDSGGNAYVAVTSKSAIGFPGAQNASDQAGIFVSKLAPQGTLVYSYFHPNGTAGGITLDAAGAVYVAGSSTANPSPATKIFGPTGSTYAIAFKISSDGTKKLYETALGGSVQTNGTAIAVDNAGEVYLAGSTSSVDFPLAHPLQSSPGARPLWKNTGGTWTPLDDLPFALPQTLVMDPGTPATLYEASLDLGVFKSLDGGVTWTAASNGITGTSIQALAIDPAHPQTLYAAVTPAMSPRSSGVYKSVDGAASWTLIDSPAFVVNQLAVDAQNTSIIWEIGASLRKSNDAGGAWSAVSFPGSVQVLALDPRVSGNLFAESQDIFCGFICAGNQNAQLYRSVDGGANWTVIPSVTPVRPLLVDGSTNPSTVYDGLHSNSSDGGATWTPINTPPDAALGPYVLTVDRAGTLYAAVSGAGNYVSRDHAQTWSAFASFIPPRLPSGQNPAIASIVVDGSGNTLYAATDQTANTGFGADFEQASTAGFVTKLSADGSSMVFSTYLRGHTSMDSYLLYAAEPNAFQTQNWISAIALDAAGNVTVAGGTRAADFPMASPAQAASAGLTDAFVSSISANGSQLNFSTYFGGLEDDGALGMAVDSQGDVILVGQTWSSDFPNASGTQVPVTYGNAFVTKLAAAGPPAISAVLNAASFQPGIEAGSWTMIQGINLANTYPGRTWASSEVVNGKLPTSLDGVSVTIDGKPAFVYYISPTQINVQAPSDSATGMVDVVVTNNGLVSAAIKVQLQSAAPAFFMYPGTNDAIASRWPDYALVGNPSRISGTVAAKPGDILVLWGTGFGETSPATPAGTVVTSAPAMATPSISIGGTPVTVIGATLTPGSVGLYQIAIQLPSSGLSGEVTVQGSAGGFQSPAGVDIFVAGP